MVRKGLPGAGLLGHGALQLQSALEFIREGDVFVVTKLDRLARSITDLMAILQALGRKGRA